MQIPFGEWLPDQPEHGKNGANVANNAKELAENVDLIITCLPSPKICAEVMEAEDGVINGLSKNKIWLEMSTTDGTEVKRLGRLVSAILEIANVFLKESRKKNWS